MKNLIGNVQATFGNVFYFQQKPNAVAEPQYTWDRYRNSIFICSVHYN